MDSLEYDGIKIKKQYKNLYDKNSDIPTDLQVLINNNDIGMLFLRLVEIIGEDNIKDLGTSKFILLRQFLIKLIWIKFEIKLLLIHFHLKYNMPSKPIVTVPDPILRKISEPVEKLTNEELKLIKDLENTMYEANGIGLASIQVGIPKRIVVIDVSKDAKIKKPNYFINPVIKSFSNETSVYEEGCLSIPETFIEIERPKKGIS